MKFEIHRSDAKEPYRIKIVSCVDSSANGSANETLWLADRLGSADSVTATPVGVRHRSLCRPGLL